MPEPSPPARGARPASPPADPDHARKLLEHRGMRRTVGRTQALQCVLRDLAEGEVFTPFALRARLRRQGCDVGMSTLYRVLADLCRGGLIELVPTGTDTPHDDGSRVVYRRPAR